MNPETWVAAGALLLAVLAQTLYLGSRMGRLEGQVRIILHHLDLDSE